SATQTASATTTPSPTITPTVTSTPPPFTSTPTEIPPTNTPQEPTMAFPDGRPLQFFYDTYSFYMWNPGGSNIPVGELSFQGLDAAGNLTGESFSGTTWAQFYFAIEGGNCMSIEMTQAPALLQPGVCRFYNARITPQRTSSMVFWNGDGNTTQFQINWGDQVIGICPAGEAECTVRVP
ncbi:MAG: hypothetical protein GYB66_00570, partial [Chloroflexi bacterium]|nr:hypothetical protein [Chloroflexota bacterium]